jgi:hypothetical protein
MSQSFFIRPSSGIVALIACGVLGAAEAEPVIGQFELKTLDSARGSFEFQSQNAWSWGHPSRQVRNDDSGLLVFDENAVIRQRHALELEAGLTSNLKMRVGLEFEKERVDEPETPQRANAFDDLQLTEFGVELIAILVPRRDEGASLGLVAEFERPRDREEPDKLILGPIAEFRFGRWFIAAVPMVVRTFGGDDGADSAGDEKWDFMYATQLAYDLSERCSLALEGYGTIERLDSNEHSTESAQLFRDFNQHRVGVVFYYEHGLGDSDRVASPSSSEDDMSLTVGIGLLEGINDHTPDHTLKLSVEVDF